MSERAQRRYPQCLKRLRLCRNYRFTTFLPPKRRSERGWSAQSSLLAAFSTCPTRWNRPWNTPYIQIGRKGRKPRHLKPQKYPNAIKQALHYQDLLESGQADSQGKLAHLIGTPRTTISNYLRLLVCLRPSERRPSALTTMTSGSPCSQRVVCVGCWTLTIPQRRVRRSRLCSRALRQRGSHDRRQLSLSTQRPTAVIRNPVGTEGKST